MSEVALYPYRLACRSLPDTYGVGDAPRKRWRHLNLVCAGLPCNTHTFPISTTIKKTTRKTQTMNSALKIERKYEFGFYPLTIIQQLGMRLHSGLSSETRLNTNRGLLGCATRFQLQGYLAPKKLTPS